MNFVILVEEKQDHVKVVSSIKTIQFKFTEMLFFEDELQKKTCSVGNRFFQFELLII